MISDSAVGPKTIVAQQTHEEKYREEGETFQQSQRRVARSLADNPEHEELIYNIFVDQRFMPGGRIQAAMGSNKFVTPYNCFVSGTIHDSFVHGDGSIMQRATEAATTLRTGGGDGYNFGTLRPRGAHIKKLNSKSTGPIAFMHIYDAIGAATSSTGNRRGAQMAVMPIWHPSIEEFIDAKKPPKSAAPIEAQVDYWRAEAQKGTPGAEEKFWEWFNALQATLRLTHFNISCGVTDHFMRCLEAGAEFKLEWQNEVYKTLPAQELWDRIMRSTWDWAEPGVMFLDTINNDNNLWYCEEISATNPCGEQPLPPNGACLLGSFNLVKYIKVDSTGARYFDIDQFMADIKHVVRAMDNVVDRAIYPLPEQREEAVSKRRMGLGVCGVANAIEALGYPYGSPKFLEVMEWILKTLAHEAYKASIDLAVEKGSFPLLDTEKYLQSGFCKRVLTPEIRDAIRRFGIRNSHLLSIAPTGTISLTADNISSGIEPVFAYSQKRLINFNGGKQEVDLLDYGFAQFGVRGVKADQVPAEGHLQVLARATYWVDSAVSKTCNVSPDMPWEDFKNLYYRAWKLGCKGLTTFNKGGKRAGILKDMDDVQACTIDPVTGRKTCD